MTVEGVESVDDAAQIDLNTREIKRPNDFKILLRSAATRKLKSAASGYPTWRMIALCCRSQNVSVHSEAVAASSFPSATRLLLANTVSFWKFGFLVLLPGYCSVRRGKCSSRSYP